MLSLSWPTVHKDGYNKSSRQSIWTAPWWLDVVQVPPPSSQSRTQIFFRWQTVWTGRDLDVLRESGVNVGGRGESQADSVQPPAHSHSPIFIYCLLSWWQPYWLLLPSALWKVKFTVEWRENTKNVHLLWLTTYQTSMSCYVDNVQVCLVWLKRGKTSQRPVVTQTSQRWLAPQLREECFN